MIVLMVLMLMLLLLLLLMMMMMMTIMMGALHMIVAWFLALCIFLSKEAQ